MAKSRLSYRDLLAQIRFETATRSLIAAGMISTTAIAEDIVTDTGKAVGGVAGGAVGAGAGAVKGAVEGVPEGAEKCYDATGMPITCGTVGAAGGAVEGTVEGAGKGAVEGARVGKRVFLKNKALYVLLLPFYNVDIG